jgi:hypothetical protein
MMAQLAARSGPPLETRLPAPLPSPAPAARASRSGTVGAVQVAPPPAAVSRRTRRAEGPTVQIGSIEVTVTRPTPPSVPPQPVPAAQARPRVAARAAGGGRLSRPAPLYGLAQG